MSTPATDAVAAAREAQEAEPVQARIEVPDMHPDAAMEMAKKAIAHVVTEAGLEPEIIPDIAPGTEQWDAVGGSISTATTGNDPDVDLLVVRIVYVPAMVDPDFITLLLQTMMAMASSAPRGSQPHQALLSAAHGHNYDDGLPDQEKLADKEVETMGGKGSTRCPDCGNDLNATGDGQVTGHRADCPRAKLPPFPGAA